MKANTEENQKQPGDVIARIDSLDGQLGQLDVQIEKNRAALERNNTRLNLRLIELSKWLASSS